MGQKTVVTFDRLIHIALNADEVGVLDHLDGTLTIDELSAHHSIDVEDLVDDLREAGFLTDAVRTPEQPVVISRIGLEFGGFDRVVREIDRAIGAALAHRAILILATLVAVAGPGAAMVSSPGPARFSEATTLLALIGWMWASSFVHEVAHALVISRSGRRVGRAGFGLHWGAVAFFVDATDALFLPRRKRVLQTLAGPFADATSAGGLALAAWVLGPGPVSALFVQMAILSWISVLVNLSPLLELDGQHALEDLLDEPDLHKASLEAARQLRRHPDRRTRLLALYGVGAVLVGVGAVLVSIHLWWTQHVPLLMDSWRSGGMGRATAVLFAAPTILGLGAAIAHALGVFLHSNRGGDNHEAMYPTHQPRSEGVLIEPSLESLETQSSV